MASGSKVINRMAVLGVRDSKLTYPTGKKDFSVMQSFPGGFSAEESDPFLMCDRFGPTVSKGVATDPDDFPIGWHPHRGMDIMTYMTQGVGRHADSMGHRQNFASPGLQWISVGSGIEHAEGGGTARGELEAGFQVWINVPSDQKMADPRYGVCEPTSIPSLRLSSSSSDAAGVQGRLLAGRFADEQGPFQTVQSVLVLDLELEPKAAFSLDLSELHDNCLVYAYEGQGRVNGRSLLTHQVARLDGSDAANRSVELEQTGEAALKVMVFAGARLNQPVAWHGPFVMTTDAEIQKALYEYQRGTLLKKRAAWDYKVIASKPKEEEKSEEL